MTPTFTATPSKDEPAQSPDGHTLDATIPDQLSEELRGLTVSNDQDHQHHFHGKSSGVSQKLLSDILLADKGLCIVYRVHAASDRTSNET